MSTAVLPARLPHHAPADLGDRFALAATKCLRFAADTLFRDRYLHRAVVLETVAAVPGMVGAVLQHLKSLRMMKGRAEMVRTLLDEAENERMHLMAFVALCRPTWYERAMILVAQGLFFNAFFLLYLASPRVAHRLVGYFEEEAVVSYSRFAAEIEAGRIDNMPAPDFAIDYWQLGAGARLIDLVRAVWADEANHRDVNHAFSREMAGG